MLFGYLNSFIILTFLGNVFGKTHLRQDDVGNYVDDPQLLYFGRRQDSGPSKISQKDAADVTSAEDEKNGFDSNKGQSLSNQHNQNFNDQTTQNVWLNLNAKNFFHKMDEIDDKFSDVRKQYENAVNVTDFNEKMIKAMVKTKGAAARTIFNHNREAGTIPAGLQLGGYGHMRLKDSILFFRRMKLRNDTRFQINKLNNDLLNMTLFVELALNDLHIVATYEKALVGNSELEIIETPSYGIVEFLLKNVGYKLEGRYRPIKDRLTIEHVISKVTTKDVIMTYKPNEGDGSSKPVTLQSSDINKFLEKIQQDLNSWLKDYFNDYLMYFGNVGRSAHKQFLKYSQHKTSEMNKYVDDVLEKIKTEIRKRSKTAVLLPNFSFSVPMDRTGIDLNLTNGELRGLESIYRRSVATSRKDGEIRRVNAIVGFSKLKVMYKYSVIIKSKTPVLTGHVILSANDLTAHMEVMLVEDSGVEDLTFCVYHQTRPESLTIEGPGNRIIGNIKHSMQNQILSFMTTALNNKVMQLRSIIKYEDLLTPVYVYDRTYSEDEKGQNSNIPDQIVPSTLNPEPDSVEIEDLPDYNDTENMTDENSDINQNKPEISSASPKPGISESETHITEVTPTDIENGGHEMTPSTEVTPTDTENGGHEMTPDYVVAKDETVELEFPDYNNKKMILKHKENFTLTKVNESINT